MFFYLLRLAILTLAEQSCFYYIEIMINLQQ